MLRKATLLKPLFLGIFAGFIGLPAIFAQKIRAGYSLYLDFNLYHWYKTPINSVPNTKSAGQLLNLFPIGGFGVWMGVPGSATLGLEGGMDYMPFSFDTKEKNGLGAVSFPVLLRWTQPFKSQSGIAPFLGFGIGEQWNRIGLYARPSAVAQDPHPYFRTYIAELSLGMGAGWHADEKQTGLLAFFARVGSAPDKAWTLNFGLRAKLLINPTSKKAVPVPPKKVEKQYQTILIKEDGMDL